jgi:hypothetical protein
MSVRGLVPLNLGRQRSGRGLFRVATGLDWFRIS